MPKLNDERSKAMKIHLVSTRSLAKELTSTSMTPNLGFVYFAIWLIFVSAVNYYDAYMMGRPDTQLIVHGAAVISISIVGLYLCFAANGGVNGSDLLARFVALSLPLTIKLEILYETVYWMLHFLYPRISSSLTDADYESAWRGTSFVLAIGFVIAWYWRMCIWLARIRASK